MRLENSDVLEDRFSDQGANRVTIAYIPNGVEVTEIYDMQQLLVRQGNAGPQGNAPIFTRRNPGSNLLRRGQYIACDVGVGSVETALRDDDMIATRRCTSESDRSHSRFRASVQELDFLTRWNVGTKHLGKSDRPPLPWLTFVVVAATLWNLPQAARFLGVT